MPEVWVSGDVAMKDALAHEQSVNRQLRAQIIAADRRAYKVETLYADLVYRLGRLNRTLENDDLEEILRDHAR